MGLVRIRFINISNFVNTLFLRILYISLLIKPEHLGGGKHYIAKSIGSPPFKESLTTLKGGDPILLAMCDPGPQNQSYVAGLCL